MKNIPQNSTLRQRLAAAGVAMVCTLAGLPIHAATFPSNPLITGGEGIPPNILLILDDSGSMAWQTMPRNEPSSMGDNPTWRSYVNNTIYYNPATDYKPWRTSSTNLDDRLSQANIRFLSSSDTTPTSRDLDIRNDVRGYFYMPRENVTDPGTSSSNYDKYRIAASSSSNSVSGAVVQRQEPSSILASGSFSDISRGDWSSCIKITPGSADRVTFVTSSGSGDGDLYVYTNDNCSGSYADRSTGNNNAETIAYSSPSSVMSFRISAASRTRNIRYVVTAEFDWKDATPVYKVMDDGGNLISQQRTQREELQNFANWYDYFRTRAKTAKAGASEAFGRLGSRYRVGFDTIWNRNAGGSIIKTSGNNPAYPIPYATEDGLFTDEGLGATGNRSNFFSRLQGAAASSGTPLHGALDRAGRYFKNSDGPWRNSDSNSLLSCRQNYAILTTDGYWNEDDGYTSNVGNTDAGTTYSDTKSNTLADVAYYYWANDLRSDMTNNVRPGGGDPATWQHMVTFGISIGLEGTLDTSRLPPANWDSVNPWTRGDQVFTDNGQVIPQRIDDLWHAALNGHGKFVVAGNAEEFASALKAALDTISERTASGSNIASSSTKTDTTTLTFSAKFTSGSWIGDMSASPFNAALTGVSTTTLWTLSDTFAAGQVNADFANRFVMATWNGLPVQFNTSYAGASLFERTGGVDAVTGAENINYLLGDQSNEVGQVNGKLRARSHPIGDIVDSSPSYNSDTNTVYIGANDGMMHAIKADDGKVLFSYMPAGMVVDDLKMLSSDEYQHRYFMDGQIDNISRAQQGYGKNILIGAPGRGAKGVFALDVTNPAAMSTDGFLWDMTANVDADMGHVLGNIRLRKSNKLDASGKSKIIAIVPNGIDSNSGKAVLFVYELSSSGSIDATHKLTTDNATGNGMMSTGMADLDANGTMDTLYGGDLLGRVWKWDISVLDAANPMPTVGTKLFQTTDGTTAQPITGGIGVARDSSGQIFVGFGTGRLISLSDLPGNAGYVAQTQSLYGIKDTGVLVTRAQLQQRSIPFTGTMNNLPVRGFEAYADLPVSAKGWYVNLGVPAATAAGERVIHSPTIVGSAMWLTSVIPAQGSDCSGALGSGYLNVLNIFTGTSPLQSSYFDTDGTIGSGGLVGSMGITGGMPTEVNVTTQLATVGDGGGGLPISHGRRPPNGGTPERMTWREVVPSDD